MAESLNFITKHNAPTTLTLNHRFRMTELQCRYTIYCSVKMENLLQAIKPIITINNNYYKYILPIYANYVGISGADFIIIVILICFFFLFNFSFASRELTTRSYHHHLFHGISHTTHRYRNDTIHKLRCAHANDR